MYWCTSLITALSKQRQVELKVQSQCGLWSKIQNSHAYDVESIKLVKVNLKEGVLKHAQNKKKNNKKKKQKTKSKACSFGHLVLALGLLMDMMLSVPVVEQEDHAPRQKN